MIFKKRTTRLRRKLSAQTRADCLSGNLCRYCSQGLRLLKFHTNTSGNLIELRNDCYPSQGQKAPPPKIPHSKYKKILRRNYSGIGFVESLLVLVCTLTILVQPFLAPSSILFVDSQFTSLQNRNSGQCEYHSAIKMMVRPDYQFTH